MPPILLVHGALGDARSYGPVIDALGAGLDVRAITLSYFGTAAWRGDGSDFGGALHARDIIDYIEAMMEPPVVLVGWSYSVQPALIAALQRPDLIHTLITFEASMSSFVADDALRHEFGADAGLCFGEVAKVLEAEGEQAAAHRMFANVSRTEGFVEKLPPEARRVVLDNARMLPLMMGKGEPPVRITAEQVRSLKVPLIAAMGGKTRPTFAIPTRELARIAPGGRLEVVEDAGHLLPIEDPPLFAKALSGWLEGAGLL